MDDAVPCNQHPCDPEMCGCPASVRRAASLKPVPRRVVRIHPPTTTADIPFTSGEWPGPLGGAA